MPALYATLGIYPPEPCPARNPVSAPPEELEGSERRRRRRLALGLLKGALLVAAAVQVIRTDRRYSASLSGGGGGGGAGKGPGIGAC